MVGRGLRCRGEGRQGCVICYLFFNLPRSGGWNGLVVDYGAIGGVRVVKFVLRSLVVVILIEVLEEANQFAGLAHLVGQDFGVGFDFAGFGGGAGPGAGGAIGWRRGDHTDARECMNQGGTSVLDWLHDVKGQTGILSGPGIV